MQFANPAYLFGLLGLLVPIAIHLWSKKEGRVIKFGSVKLLQDSDSKQTSKIKINELWLLFLRLLMILLVVLILAEPFFKTTTKERPVLVLIEPVLKDHERVLAAIDTLQEDRYAVGWLNAGFPDLDESYEQEKVDSYWHLIKDLNHIAAKNVVIISTSNYNAVRGRRPKVNKSVSWITLESKADQGSFYVEAVKSKDSLIVTKGSSNTLLTDFLKESFQLDQVSIDESKVVVPEVGKSVDLLTDTLSIWIEENDEFESDYKYVQVALQTIEEYTNWPVKFASNQSPSVDWMIMWSQSKKQNNAANWLYYQKDTLANNIIQATKDPNSFQLTSRLDDHSVVERGFINALFDIIRNERSSYKEVLNKNDKRLIADRQLQPEYSPGEFDRSGVQPLNHWLWGLLLLLVLGERTLAFIRNQ